MNETHGKEGSLPQELRRFFEAPGGHSLVVKGEAGTGKTTLALQLIETLAGSENQYYLSSRVSDESLFRQFPWLKETSEKVRLLKASKAFLLHMSGGRPPSDEGEGKDEITQAMELLKTLNERGEKLTVDRTELHRLEGQIEEGSLSGEDFVPTHLSGESGSIDLVLGRLLPELEVAYDRVEENLPERSLIVIDSIDGLSEKYDIPAERLLSVIQKDIVESSGANVVYVLESSGGSHIDYLGDGVVSMSSLEMSGRRVRMITLEKLRGVRIERHRYAFTLSNGRLEVFPPSPIRIQMPRRTWRPTTDAADDMISFGSFQLDNILGGLQRGSVLLVELGPDVPSIYSDVIQDVLVANFAYRGNGVAWVPSRKSSYITLHDRISALTGEEKFEKNVRIFEHDPSAPSDTPYLIPLEGNNFQNDLKWDTIEYNFSSSHPPYLSLMGFDVLESMYSREGGKELLDGLVDHVGEIRKGGHVLVAQALSSSTEHLRWLSDISLSHIKLENVEGTVMLYGIKPFTQFYAMVPDVTTEDNLGMRLVPIS
ncbi:MAG: gas vesicle protein GvpD P-loop domain-containing protein [Methanomassiliicoccales archaeon]